MLAAKHTPTAVSPANASRWTELLIENDRRYFSAGATSHRVAGTELVVMPNLAHYSIGAVCFIDDPAPVLSRPRAWRDAIIDLCAAEGARQIRLYTHATDTCLSSALSAAGLAPSVEIAMAGYTERILASPVESDEAFGLREVATHERWQAKRLLHERTPERPDGKAIDARAWVELEREKVRAGYMTAWLIEKADAPCGAFGISFQPEMARFKNLFVAPEHRRHGAAAAAILSIAREARARGIPAIGCWVLAAAHSARLYERAGLVRIGSQIEWTLPLATASQLSRARVRDAVG